MLIKTKALVLKEQNIGENDRLITLLTCDRGIIRAFAKMAGKSKGAVQNATELLSYSEFMINIGKTSNRVREAQAIEIYFGLRQDIEKVALAQYFVQLASEAQPEVEECSQLLRVILNSLHFLHKSLKNPNQLKAIVELKTACLSGYAPQLHACCVCLKESDKYVFDFLEGSIYCESCKKESRGAFAYLNQSLLSALRYIAYSPVEEVFSFNMSDESFKLLSEITEGYVITQFQRNFTALDFYKSLSKL